MNKTKLLMACSLFVFNAANAADSSIPSLGDDDLRGMPSLSSSSSTQAKLEIEERDYTSQEVEAFQDLQNHYLTKSLKLLAALQKKKEALSSLNSSIPTNGKEEEKNKEGKSASTEATCLEAEIEVLTTAYEQANERLGTINDTPSILYDLGRFCTGLREAEVDLTSYEWKSVTHFGFGGHKKHETFQPDHYYKHSYYTQETLSYNASPNQQKYKAVEGFFPTGRIQKLSQYTTLVGGKSQQYESSLKHLTDVSQHGGDCNKHSQMDNFILRMLKILVDKNMPQKWTKEEEEEYQTLLDRKKPEHSDQRTREAAVSRFKLRKACRVINDLILGIVDGKFVVPAPIMDSRKGSSAAVASTQSLDLDE